ncbi:phosphoglucosamine mutase [Amphibiibacter pelophylacis]|uniref:Phosphoglucosamine mutase n=1 Tax=Amphibiibacter pelophylacis TaxID=1799477 RepID=A0ACC6NZV9_9BURK
MSTQRQYFGTDGIRGRVGVSPITADFALRLGHAVGVVLRRTHERPRVILGKDTRISGYMLEAALEAGFASAGVDVRLTGPLPTPGVAHLTRAMRAQLGVVISASHNPFEDNGIKFFSASGEKLPDAWELDVEAALAQPPQWAGSAQLGRARRLNDAQGRYIEFCKSTLSPGTSFAGLKLVVDAAHGAAYQVAPQVFEELGATVIPVGCQPNGLNINLGVGATHPEALAQAVLEHGADYGVALDGDADRLQMVDGAGRIFNGDELLYVLVQDRIARGQTVSGAVGTLMTNLAVEAAFRRQGVELLRAKVGDRYVLEGLKERGWLLGGESSGHLLMLDRHTTGDGLISALQVLQAVQFGRKSLAQLLDGVQLCPQIMHNVRLKPGQDWAASAAVANCRRQVEAELGESGRILIRASGTEPVLRVMVEAFERDQAESCARRLADVIMAV